MGTEGTSNSSSLVGRDRARPAVVWELWWSLGAACGVSVVVLALFWFAQPLADDFARGYKGRIQGVVPATVYEYHTWTGRWAASGLSYFLTSSFDLVDAYPFLLLINPTLLALSVYAVLHAAAIGESIRQRLALTACLLALYWAGMPHPGDTFYWLTGGSDNLAGLALSLLLIAGLLRHLPRRKVTSWVTGGSLPAGGTGGRLSRTLRTRAVHPVSGEHTDTVAPERRASVALYVLPDRRVRWVLRRLLGTGQSRAQG